MKKTLIIFIFIFLTGLFAGLFFSTGLSTENSTYLSAQLLAGFSSPSAGFFRIFFAALSWLVRFTTRKINIFYYSLQSSAAHKNNTLKGSRG